MVKNRVPVDKEADPSILCEKLEFKTSGRVANNRLLKVSIWVDFWINDYSELFTKPFLVSSKRPSCHIRSFKSKIDWYSK
jgi:hypothetical protein